MAPENRADRSLTAAALGVLHSEAMAQFNYEAVKDLICCPKTRAGLVYTGDALICCDPGARLRYPIVDGFPVLLVDEATTLSVSEWSSVMTASGRDPVTGAAASAAPPKG